MKIRYSLASGEIVEGPAATVADPGEGFAVVEVPGSALLSESIWSASARAFVEVPRRARADLLALFTEAELAALLASSDAGVGRLLTGIALAERPIRATAAWFVAGVEAAEDAGFLTSARVAQVLAFQEPA